MRIPLILALALWVLSLLGVLGLSLGLPLASALPAIQILILIVGLVGIRFFLPDSGFSFREKLRLRGQPAGELVLAGLAAILLLPGLQLIFDRLFRGIPGYLEYLTQQQTLIVADSQGLGFGFLLLTIVFLPAICEEVFFRGYLSQALREAGLRQSLIIGLGGFLFGLFHLDPWRLLPVSILGMLMIWLVEVGGSLLPAMLFHLVNNGTIFLASYLGASEDRTLVEEAEFSLGQSFFIGLLFILGLLALISYAQKARLRRSKTPSPFS